MKETLQQVLLKPRSPVKKRPSTVVNVVPLLSDFYPASFISTVNYRHAGEGDRSFNPDLSGVVHQHGEGSQVTSSDGAGPRPVWQPERHGLAFDLNLAFLAWLAAAASLSSSRFASLSSACLFPLSAAPDSPRCPLAPENQTYCK
jgi:hypothetical protein